ncbi:hypothetical protein PWT90_00539 [Aphanocladium album]|nr:hypothetical protein PWT90_00539 [Aphanocladium album]
MSLRQSLIAALLVTSGAQATDLRQLPSFLKQVSSNVWPALKDISVAIYHDPEVGLDEHLAHDRVVRHFHGLDDWTTKPSAYGMSTAFEMSFEHIPKGYRGPVKTIGFLAEYDALVGVGHACGHNHIVLNGMTAAILTSQALKHFDIPGRVKLMGCPDEENAAGKYTLNQRGAFNSSDIWLMAHPTSKSAVQPMNARLNIFGKFLGKTHKEAVGKAYQAMATVRNLGKLPGTASSVAAIQNVGVYATNVVQSFISLGVSGMSLPDVNGTVSAILDKTYPGVSYKIFQDEDGVALNITGPGGHGSEASKGPLTLSIEVFRAASSRSGVEFYLPGNTTATELDVTVDLRSRYTADLPALAKFVTDSIAHLSDNLSHDVKYPALEVVPYVPETFISILGSDDYGLRDWNITDFAPASSDASWMENPVLDPQTHHLNSVDRVVLHANYNICGKGANDPCAFNHEPKFALVAGTEYSYTQTEIVARGQAHMAVELLADASKWKKATAIIQRS